jgi:hypothetical protein
MSSQKRGWNAPVEMLGQVSHRIQFCGECARPTFDTKYRLPLSCGEHIICAECLTVETACRREDPNVGPIWTYRCTFCKKETHPVFPDNPSGKISAKGLDRLDHPELHRAVLDRLCAQIYCRARTRGIPELAIPVTSAGYSRIRGHFETLVSFGFGVVFSVDHNRQIVEHTENWPKAFCSSSHNAGIVYIRWDDDGKKSEGKAAAAASAPKKPRGTGEGKKL